MTRKKSPNVNKSCPKIISLEKLSILKPLQKLPKNFKDLGNLIFAKGFINLPKVKIIAKSGHTVCLQHLTSPGEMIANIFCSRSSNFIIRKQERQVWQKTGLEQKPVFHLGRNQLEAAKLKGGNKL